MTLLDPGVVVSGDPWEALAGRRVEVVVSELLTSRSSWEAYRARQAQVEAAQVLIERMFAAIETLDEPEDVRAAIRAAWADYYDQGEDRVRGR